MKQPEPFGKFLLLGQVALGGMAEIYKARYADPSKPQVDLALKRILPSYTEDESFVTMFKDEGNIAVRLKHPNIVNVYECGEVNNDWYMAMEFVHGSDLRVLSDACEKYNKRFTPVQVARIMCDTAKALDYAHACKDESGVPLNIVHRDCTPHNIMIAHDNNVKLMDFGIAKAASRATKTRVGTVKGKSSYMSPEQARGKQLDGRSDMFTLGIVAWEMLTGYRLFKASSDYETLSKILKSFIVPPWELDSNVPQSLGKIIMETLERDREMRYPTCGVLAEELENWLAINGDGSDAHLGDYCMALTNAKGHSISEIPDYTPGVSMFNYVDCEFVQKNSVPQVPRASVQPQPAAMPSAPMPNVNPMGAMPQQAYPPPSMIMPVAMSRLPAGYVVAYVSLGLIIVGALILCFKLMHSPDAEPVEAAFILPEVLVDYKSDPSDAAVYVNDVQLVDEDGKPLLTPIYSNSRKFGDTIIVRFEKEGYEPVTVERKVFSKFSIDVDLLKTDEVKLAQKKVVPEFTIKTSPAGAKIKVNGEDKGEAPVKLENIAYGENLQIVASLDGGKHSLNRVVIASENLGSDMQIKFDSSARATAKEAPAAPVKTVAKSTAKKGKSKASSKVASGTGTISVKAKPWGVVTIDGTRIGNTPTSKSVNAGKHKVMIHLPNKNIKVNQTVTVNPNKTTTVGYDFNTSKWM